MKETGSEREDGTRRGRGEWKKEWRAMMSSSEEARGDVVTEACRRRRSGSSSAPVLHTSPVWHRSAFACRPPGSRRLSPRPPRCVTDLPHPAELRPTSPPTSSPPDPGPRGHPLCPSSLAHLDRSHLCPECGTRLPTATLRRLRCRLIFGLARNLPDPYVCPSPLSRSYSTCAFA